MLQGMVSHHIGFFVIVAAVALVLATYASRSILLAAALVALVCGGAVGVQRLRARRQKRTLLHDPGVSTLVFPPESRFR
jgi:hypothetical protein